MKFSLSILTTALVCISDATTVQAGKQVDCLDAKRYNLENVCRNECAKENSVAFSVSYNENNDSCRCFPNIDGLGTYTGNGDRETHLTCYSMAPGERTKVLDYGDCMVDSSNGAYGTEHPMQMCDEEHQVDCVDHERHNVETYCRKECSKHDSVAFAVSFVEDDDVCRCYPPMAGTYTGNGFTLMSCFSMDGPRTKILGYGECVPAGTYAPRVIEHTLKRCGAKVEKLLRGSASA